jgi:hypothetical protein
MIRHMAQSNDDFINTCAPLLERMVNTVPKGVKLSDPWKPIPCKPDFIDITIDPLTGNMTLTGQVRV